MHGLTVHRNSVTASIKGEGTVPRKRKTIFICYSRADRTWLERLRTVLAPYTAYRLDPWDDTRIPPGADWRSEIERALAHANAVICLVTPHFFASDFITKKELKVILRRHDRDRLPVVWIPVSASGWKVSPVRRLQAGHNPARPLDKLSKADRNAALVKIVETVSTCATESGLWGILATTDKITQDIIPGADPGIMAQRGQNGIEFRNRRGAKIHKIDPPRLSRLSKSQRNMIATYHSSMANAFERWQALYPRRGSLTEAERRSFRRARRQMCDDLDKAIKFLDKIKIYLPDHYRTVRNECQQKHQAQRVPRSSR